VGSLERNIMSTSNSSSSSGGIGFFALLGILFIGLKLTHYIAWSWLYVLMPLWIPLAVLLAFLIFAAICFVLGAIFD
jgi:hypothetical protein